MNTFRKHYEQEASFICSRTLWRQLHLWWVGCNKASPS